MVRIKKQLVTGAKRSRRTHAGYNTREFITIHETANLSKGAGAQTHANLQSRGNPREASWNWQVDDTIAIQSFADTDITWHAGAGNRRSIAIEICVNSDGDFAKAVQNAAELTAMLMKQHGIPLSKVVQHHYWTGKNCPTFLRSGRKGINWSQFIAMVREAYNGGSVAHVVATKPQSGGNEMDYKKYLYGQTLWSGMGGAAVKRMQEDLTEMGFPLRADGSYGPATKAAVTAFQKRNGLTADGIAGEATQAKMRDILNAAKAPKLTPAQQDEADIDEAIRLGITNGENLNETASRRQVVLMIMRARRK